MKKTEISIIIVNYRVKKELFECISSILQSETKASFEIIVVDNDEEQTIEKDLNKQFPRVTYIKSGKNLGFGAGNNLGAKHAKGEFLFFLNPDTILQKDTVDRLVKFIEKNKNIGIVAPLLLDRNNKPYPLQGTKELNPLNGIIGLSFLNKLFPNNLISKNYWLLDWDKKGVKEVDVVPGTAFIIRRSIFEKIGGFDERFFLFFEENDLCKRVKRLGYKIFINPKSRVIHLWGKSTSQFKETKTIFAKSRFKYFQKHHGVIWAVLVECTLGINKLNLLLSVILILALFLRLYRLSELMPFIGDQGWFYLSARDMLLTGNIPLVGPETSHPWIHHGPLWTYLLAIILWIFHFNPVAPSYFIAILGVTTVWLIYKLSCELFSKRVGLVTALLYATSSLIVLNSRIAYHTSPIPFFTLLLVYMVYKWLQGNVRYVPFIFFLMAVLYNHELTTFVFFIPILVLVLYGLRKKKKWATDMLNRKIIVFSFFAFLIPMLPFLIYDINHGYKQTLGFLVWVLYRVIKLPFATVSSHVFPREFFLYIQQLIFAPSFIVSFIIFVASFSYLVFSFIKKLRAQTLVTGSILLFLFLFIPPIGIFIHREPIEADTLMMSPFIIMATSFLFDKLISFRFLKYPFTIFLLFICFSNVYFLQLKSEENRLTFKQRLHAVGSIIKESGGREYNLVGRGVLSEFPSFTMNYEYLLWWKGYPPKKENVELKIIVWEKEGEIIVYEQK